MEQEVANEEHVQAALEMFVAFYNNGEFSKIAALLTEKPKATFIGTGDQEFITGRKNILKHWIEEPRDGQEPLRLAIAGSTEFGFHGDVVCLVTRLNLENAQTGETVSEMRLSGYVVCQEGVWKWASIHLSTPDPTQDQNQQYPSGVHEPQRKHDIDVDHIDLDDLPVAMKSMSGFSRDDFVQLILTATATERDAILEKLGPPTPDRKILKVTLAHEQDVYLGTFGNFGAIVTQCPDELMAEDASEVAFYRVLDKWTPKALVMFGRAVLNPRVTDRAGAFLVAPSSSPTWSTRMSAGGHRLYGRQT